MGTGRRKFGASLRTFVFCDFYVKLSSGYSLVHILPTSSFKNAPNMPEVQTELLLKSGAHFANLIFQKCSERFSFFTSWNANWTLATILCAFLSTTFADREPHPRKQRPYFGDPRSQITRKNTGLLCGWHNDKTAPGCSSKTRKCSNLPSLGPQRKNMQKFEIEEPPDMSKGQGKWVKGVTL